MEDTESSIWTLVEHSTAGMAAIAQIEADPIHVGPEPVCHHFYELVPVDPMKVSLEETYVHLAPRFAALGVEFLPDRLEAWETTKPTIEWLEGRILAIFEAAKASGLVYQGWTWEPRGRQPIAASEIQVINNRSS